MSSNMNQELQAFLAEEAKVEKFIQSLEPDSLFAMFTRDLIESFADNEFREQMQRSFGLPQDNFYQNIQALTTQAFQAANNKDCCSGSETDRDKGFESSEE